jgi:cyanate permease
VWAVFAGGLVAGAYMTKVPPALPALRGELGITLIQSGLIVTTFNVLGMLTGMLAGLVCERLGQSRVSAAGLLVMAAGGLLGASAHGFALLLVSRFVEGVGFILFAVPAPALMTSLTASARERAKALGIWSAYMPTGGTIALLVAPALIAVSGWRALWAALAAAALAAAAVIGAVVPRSHPTQASSFRLVAETVNRPGNIAMALLFACYVAQWTSIMVWLPTFLTEQGVAASAAALATALMVLVNAPGNLSGGWLLSRGVPRGRLVLGASAIAALCEIGMFAAALPAPLRFALVLGFSLCSGTIPASIFAGLPVHARSPQHIATGNGMVLQFSNLGQFLGPLAIAWLASRFGGWSAGLWALLAFAAAGAACGAALARIEARPRG